MPPSRTLADAILLRAQSLRPTPSRSAIEDLIGLVLLSTETIDPSLIGPDATRALSAFTARVGLADDATERAPADAIEHYFRQNPLPSGLESIVIDALAAASHDAQRTGAGQFRRFSDNYASLENGRPPDGAVRAGPLARVHLGKKSGEPK